MYQLKAWAPDGSTEVLYVETWEEVICVLWCLEEDMYLAIVVWNGETGRKVFNITCYSPEA